MTATSQPAPQVVLASTSPYRATLLARLGLAFEQRAPGVDETREPGETASAYVARVAAAKARAGADRTQRTLAIGSDQVCTNGDTITGKPGNLEAARHQLREASGHRIAFLTAVTVHDSLTDHQRSALCSDDVVFNNLDAGTIERYLAAEQPFDCAGAFRVEGLGITLVEAVHSDDPTSLIGLPLIATSRLLRAHGLELP